MLIAWKVLKPFRDRKKRFIVLFGFFSANHSRTTEGISTGKTLQERFSWDLSDGSNSKVCLHLKFMLRQKKHIGAKQAIWKKRFFWFYGKIAADTAFRSAALEKCKNTTHNKKSKLFKMFYWTFCQLFFKFWQLVRNFLDHWYNFFYSQYFCFKFGRML